jgi:hypothetical protein
LHEIGRFVDLNNRYLDGYLTEINMVDGQQLDATSFGEFNTDTGVWQPKAYTGSYGTNGFYLDFADNSGTTSTTLGADSSGNGNNWTPNNFSVTAGAGNDSLVDSPTRYGTDTGAGGEVRGNYATLNPLQNFSGGTPTNGNLDVVTGSSQYGAILGTIGMTAGKWYWEILVVSNSGYGRIGISQSTAPFTTTFEPGSSGDNGVIYDAFNGNVKSNGSDTAYGSSYTSNDIIGVAFDADDGKIWFAKNGTWQASGNPATATNPAKTGVTGYTFLPCMSDGNSGGTSTFNCNFGQRPFAYTAPSGFKALVTTNLPAPTIEKGGEYFNTVLYTGNGSTTQSVSGVGFQPDFVWIKGRSIAAWNRLQNTVAGINKLLYSNSTNSEATDEANGYVSAVTSDGFTLADPGANGGGVNALNETYVAWNWKANGAGVSNTDGTRTSTVSVDTTSGFSIVTYSGNSTRTITVGHGLGVVPEMIIVKNRSTDTNWPVFHKSVGASKYVYLNTTGAEATDTNMWNNTAPTSTVFSLGDTTGANGNGNNMVAYCFAPVAGYSAFGSYTGNGASDGPFLYTGFRPRYVLIKGSSFASNWFVLDTARSPYNVQIDALRPNLSDTETSTGTYAIDSLSNGFKVRSGAADANTNAATFIWAAFAESPFQYSLAR